MKTIKYQDGMTVTEMLNNYVVGMPNDVYHSLPGISASGLKTIAQKSPAHYANPKPRKATRHMEIGTAIHTALLEPERFESEYILLPEVEDRRKPEYKQAVKSAGTSELVLVGQEVAKVTGMQDAAFANQEAAKLLRSDGFCELSGIVKDPVTGVICRHRFDKLCVIDGWAVDIKKTQDASYEGFQKAIYNYQYHMQAAFYLDQYEWMTGERLKGMKFVAIEEDKPHAVGVYYLDDGSLQIGRELHRDALNTYAECETNNEWPSYPGSEQAQIISLPEWALARYENELEDGGII